MRRDFSWGISARKYVDAYTQAVARHEAERPLVLTSTAGQS